MKKLAILFVISGFLMMAGTASAQVGMMYGSSVDNSTVTSSNQTVTIASVLKDVDVTQGVTDQSKLVCAKVTDDQFEKLGDAVMGSGITEAQHTAMENMMGGEGSATLKQAHITMGRSYLGCWGGYNSGPVYMPMMRYQGSGSSQGDFGFLGMMHGAGYSRFGMMGGLFMWVIWWIVFIDLVLAGVWLYRQLKK